MPGSEIYRIAQEGCRSDRRKEREVGLEEVQGNFKFQ